MHYEHLIRAIHDTPGTILVIRPGGGAAFEPTVVHVDDMSADLVAVHVTAGDESRYVTHQYVCESVEEGRRVRRNDDAVLVSLASRAGLAAYATHERWRNGDDEVARECAEDPTAWAKYCV